MAAGSCWSRSDARGAHLPEGRSSSTARRSLSAPYAAACHGRRHRCFARSSIADVRCFVARLATAVGDEDDGLPLEIVVVRCPRHRRTPLPGFGRICPPRLSPPVAAVRRPRRIWVFGPPRSASPRLLPLLIICLDLAAFVAIVCLEETHAGVRPCHGFREDDGAPKFRCSGSAQRKFPHGKLGRPREERLSLGCNSTEGLAWKVLFHAAVENSDMTEEFFPKGMNAVVDVTHCGFCILHYWNLVHLLPIEYSRYSD
ncbi:hypothetical protein ACLOJK_011210 [Asimina triloba]